LRQTESKDLHFFLNSRTLCHPERASRIRRAVVARQPNSGGKPKDLHFRSESICTSSSTHQPSVILSEPAEFAAPSLRGNRNSGGEPKDLHFRVEGTCISSSTHQRSP
jgi:hypothetical protein